MYAVVRKDWPAFTGLEVNAVIGLLAFSGLAALGAWKEVRGVDVWSLNRFKVGVLAALALDIAQVVLLALAIPRECSFFSFLPPNIANATTREWRCVVTSP